MNHQAETLSAPSHGEASSSYDSHQNDHRHENHQGHSYADQVRSNGQPPAENEMSLLTAAKLLGVDYTIAQRWSAKGWLSTFTRGQKHQRGTRMVTDGALEAFIRERGGLISSLNPRSEPWQTMVAEARAALQGRLIGANEIKTRESISPWTFQTWRSQEVAPFPLPVLSIKREDWFDRAEVEAWLKENRPALSIQRRMSGETRGVRENSRRLSADELRALLRVCAEDPREAGLRDRAIIACLYPGAVQAAELPNLTLSNYDRESGALRVRNRTTYLTGWAYQVLSTWLDARRKHCGPSQQSLFLRLDVKGNIHFKSIGKQTTSLMLKGRAREAGIEVVTPALVRRTVIRDLIDAGVDSTTVYWLTGYVNTNNPPDTRTPPNEATLRAAIERLPQIAPTQEDGHQAR
ncbi:MAG: site-specific integrase [Chloroflexaceae bacterium]|nr:site-specific integrase [Chloroflexaceae bacterium]